MHRRLVVLLAIVSASGLAALVGACGGSDSTAVDGGNDATTQDTGTTDTGATDTGGPETSGGPDAAGGDAACQGLGNFGCRACCAALYPDAAAFFLDQERTCACTTPGDCKGPAVCGNNLCNGQNPSGPCNNCLRNADAGGCNVVAATACLGDPSCAPLATCVADCIGAADAGGGG
jgi:hypothetical protein